MPKKRAPIRLEVQLTFSDEQMTRMEQWVLELVKALPDLKVVPK